MPELPEVETTAALIRPKVEGRRIRGVVVDWQRSVGAQQPAAFERAVVGARITRVGRRAKYVVMDLARGRQPAGVLLCHLRMTGRLVVQPPREDPGPYRRVSLVLDRGILHFLDVRKFGRLTWHADPAERLGVLGPEPLGDTFTVAWFQDALKRRKRALKPLLLDQEFLAGLGNIYVDECLHRAGLHPLRHADRVPAARAAALHAEIRSTLREAIEREGSSFDSFYRTPEGQPGSYQDRFQVYGRDGQACLRCGRTIVKIVVGQRGTHLCTRCQPVPRTTAAAKR